MSNNPPHSVLELTEAEAEFLKKNCDSNIVFGLNALQNGELSRATCEKLVEQMEMFRAIKRKIK